LLLRTPAPAPILGKDFEIVKTPRGGHPQATSRIDARLVIGDRVLIPEGLLKNRKPLPRDLVLSLAAKERVHPPASTVNPNEESALDLFGPRE